MERRLRESYDVEIEDLKQRNEELRRRYPGSIPELLQGETGEIIAQRLQLLVEYLEENVDDDDDEDEDEGGVPLSPV